MNSFTIVEQSFYTIYVLQNLLTQAQLELFLARLESWRLSLKAGDLASMYLGVEVIVRHTSFKAQMGRFYLSLHGFIF